MKKLSSALAIACSILGLTVSHGATTDPVGAMATTLLGGGKFNLLSKPFVRSAAFQGPVVSINGTNVELGDTSALSGDYYLEVASGSLSGVMSKVVSYGSNVVTLADDLTPDLAAGNTVILRETTTVNDLFGADNTFGFKSSPNGDLDVDQPDLIYVLNPETGIVRTLFYSTFTGFVGWYDTFDFSEAGDTILYPDHGIAVLVKGPDVEVTLSGTVKSGDFVSSVFEGFNIMSLMNPVSISGSADAVTLGNSGLYTGDDSTGVVASPDGSLDSADLVYVLDESTGIISRYFYSTFPGNVGWYDVFDFQPADDVLLESGDAFYIFRSPGNGDFSWASAFNF